MKAKYEWTPKMNDNLTIKTYTSHLYDSKPSTHLDHQALVTKSCEYTDESEVCMKNNRIHPKINKRTKSEKNQDKYFLMTTSELPNKPRLKHNRNN